MTTKLTQRETLFAQEYIVDLNATQAAIRAGYSEKGAIWRAHELMKRPHVLAAIETAKAERLKRTNVDADKILEYLSDMVTADIADIFDEFGQFKPIRQWPKIWRQMVQGGDVQELYLKTDQGEGAGRIIKARFIDRMKAIELLGKHIAVGAFKPDVVVPATDFEERFREGIERARLGSKEEKVN